MPDFNNTTHDPYRFLSRISTAELKRILQEDALSEENGSAENDEFITRVMEVIIQREKENPETPSFDVDAGWESFQKNYRPPQDTPALSENYTDVIKAPAKNHVAKGKSSPSAPRRLVRRIGSLAAAVCVFMCLLVAAQAIGIDILGAIARWTDETFHFGVAPASSEIAELQSAMESYDFPIEYAPAWIPSGFKADACNHIETKNSIIVTACFSADQSNFLYSVTRFTSPGSIANKDYEKEPGEALPYSNGHQVFYILQNTDSTTATWTDGVAFTIDICGNLSFEDMTTIIDSIGG